MPKTLIRPHYQYLLNDISDIYTSSKLQARNELNKILTKAYWEIGKRIVTIEQDKEHRAQYGDNLLNRLSEDLTEQHGSGFSISNIQYMRKFFIANPKHQPAGELEWTKQCVLLSVQDKQKRLKYKDLAISQNWSRAKLVEVLKSENLTSAPKAVKQRATSNEQLSAFRGAYYTYRASPGELGYAYIDVGFSVTRQIKTFTPIEKGDVVRSLKMKEGFKLTKVKAAPKELYTYKAYLDRVIDGDTLSLHIDLGFDTFIKESVRLRGINTPEISIPKGQRAKRFVTRALKQADHLTVKTHREDKFGRYLADIWIGETYLNQKLLDIDLAVNY